MAANIKKTIYLIRHGETDFNKQGIIQGSGINSHLNEHGRKQANMFYETYKSIAFDHVYTSELIRTQQTVEAFTKNTPQTHLAELNEINWGIMEGVKQTPEMSKEYQKMVDNWSKGILEIAIENGETPLAMFNRQKLGLERIMQKTEEKYVLISMHGRAMRSFLCLLCQKPLSEMEKWGHSNVCLYILEFNGSHFDIILSNNTEHLNKFY